MGLGTAVTSEGTGLRGWRRVLTEAPCPALWPTVERRRRDKINNWIVQLSKIIPDCSMESTKSGQVSEGPGRVACELGLRFPQVGEWAHTARFLISS